MPAIIFFVLILIFSISIVSGAQDFKVDAQSAILIDAESGQVLFEQNPDEPLPPASLTKIMTLLLTMEEIESGKLSLDDKVTISRLAQSMGGSQIFLGEGDVVSVRDLLKAVTMASANDACVALGETVAGSYNHFINLMNDRANELGLRNTYFSNSTGLPTESDHYTTARDVAKMSRKLVKYPIILKDASIWLDYIQLKDRKAMITNTNHLVNTYPGLDGIKTGHTSAAGFSLAATAQRGSMRLISVVMKSNSVKAREDLTAQLLDYGFNRFTRKKYLEQGETIQNISVKLGSKEYTTGEIAKDLAVVVKRGLEGTISTEIEIDKSFDFPIEVGDKIGQAKAFKNEELITTSEIIATEKINKANFIALYWRNFVNWLGGGMTN
ncbi:MAG: D-alanyl-D-alanine carboxypeptidase [Halanaerobiales bacterium]|nr:D-alanyl-D-alanine carboxypeptidase [Halanaerobiales bacterium]